MVWFLFMMMVMFRCRVNGWVSVMMMVMFRCRVNGWISVYDDGYVQVSGSWLDSCS